MPLEEVAALFGDRMAAETLDKLVVEHNNEVEQIVHDGKVN